MDQENSYSAPNVTRMKKHWPSWAAGNGWAPDDTPTELASLSSDGVRTISPLTAIKSLILVMTDHYLLHLTVHIYYFILGIRIAQIASRRGMT